MKENLNKKLFVVKNKDEKSDYIIKIDISDNSVEKKEGVSDYESGFIVDYISSLDENAKDSFLSEIEAENSEEDSYLTVNEMYNRCISKDLWKSQDDINKMTNWIYNVVNPNTLNQDIFDEMLNKIKLEMTSEVFNSYLKHILSKDKNISTEYISPDKDLYELMLFEDILSVDYKDKYDIHIDIDAEYIGTWFREKIIPAFKSKYNENQLKHRLCLEIKKNEILDFRGENFKKFKNKITEEIDKEVPNKEIVDADFELDEKKFLEKRIKSLSPKNISELEQAFKDVKLKYDGNKEILKDYYSKVFMKLLVNDDGQYSLNELDKFINNNEQFLDEDVLMYVDMKVQKEMQKIEEKLLNDICDVKDLKSLEELHNKVLSNGDFVKCEEIESVIFRKLEALVKKLNLADINDEENIKIGNRMYDNTASIDIKDYPVAEILICRDIEIDLNNIHEMESDLKSEIDIIKDTILKNCEFNCEYYNMNIQLNEDEEKCYSIKFRYLKDLIEYVKLKEKKSPLSSFKKMNKKAQYKIRVFSKGNEELIKKIDDFYLQKQNSK